MMRKALMKAGVIAGSVLGAAAANASVITAEATTALEGIKTDVSTVGVILVIAAATAVSFKWVKGSIFG